MKAAKRAAMTSPAFQRLLLATGLLLGSGAWTRAQTAPVPVKPDTVTKPVSPAATDLPKLIEQFNAKRDAMLNDRQKLLDQLKGATDEQRKAILDQMQAQQKD